MTGRNGFFTIALNYLRFSLAGPIGEPLFSRKSPFSAIFPKITIFMIFSRKSPFSAIFWYFPESHPEYNISAIFPKNHHFYDIYTKMLNIDNMSYSDKMRSFFKYITIFDKNIKIYHYILCWPAYAKTTINSQRSQKSYCKMPASSHPKDLHFLVIFLHKNAIIEKSPGQL